MNDTTIPLYPGTEQEGLLQLHKKSDDVVISTEPQASTPNQPCTMIRHVALVGPDGSTLTCPHCKAVVRTTVKHTVTTRTHFIAMRCLICCCCCMPYCCNSMRNADHYCPACKGYIGTYEK